AARSSASVVLPTPSGPTNRTAWGTAPRTIASTAARAAGWPRVRAPSTVRSGGLGRGRRLPRGALLRGGRGGAVLARGAGRARRLGRRLGRRPRLPSRLGSRRLRLGNGIVRGGRCGRRGLPGRPRLRGRLGRRLGRGLARRARLARRLLAG